MAGELRAAARELSGDAKIKSIHHKLRTVIATFQLGELDAALEGEELTRAIGLLQREATDLEAWGAETVSVL